MSERLAKPTADEATAKAHAREATAIGGRSYAANVVPEILAGKLETLPKHVQERTRIPFGTYRGLRFGMVLNPQFPPDIYLEGSTNRSTTLSRDHQGPRAVLNALDRLASGYGPDCDRVQ